MFLFSLLQIADKYDIKSLVNKCLDELSQNLNLDNVINTLQAADLVNSDELKKAAITYITSNLKVT